jgi:hypothetical protein
MADPDPFLLRKRPVFITLLLTEIHWQGKQEPSANGLACQGRRHRQELEEAFLCCASRLQDFLL